MHPRKPKKTPLSDIITLLTTNDPRLTELNIKGIEINPTYNPQTHSDICVVKDEHLCHLAEALKNNTTIHTIIINGENRGHGSAWTAKGAHLFGESIKNHPNVKSVYIYLPNSKLPEEAIYGFFSCLTGTAPIEALSVSYHFRSMEYFKQLGKVLNQKGSLQELYINARILVQIPDESDESLICFKTGLQSLKRLKILSLKNLPLGDNGIDDIFSQTDTLRNLKKLKLSYCSIAKNISPICTFASHNPNLTLLDISGNPLEDDQAQQLINKLISLPSLRTLNLSDIGLTQQALILLASHFSSLNISYLSLDKNALDIIDPTFENILQIVKDKQLKKLDLNHCRITDAQLHTLGKILEDPNQCGLYEFSIKGHSPFKPTTYRMLTQCAYKNSQLFYIDTPTVQYELVVACEINKKNNFQTKWELFNMAFLCFMSAKYSQSPHPIHLISFDILKFIFQYIRPETQHTHKESYLLSLERISSNIQTRTRLMNEGKYNPSEQLQDNSIEINREIIKSTWWSTQSIEKKDFPVRPLFLSKQKNEPALMRLPDIISTIYPFINLAKDILGPSSTPLQDAFMIDVSHLEPGKKRYIRDVFSRFLTMYFKDWPSNVPLAILNEDTHQLIIHHINIADFKNAMQFSMNNLTTLPQESKGCCAIM